MKIDEAFERLITTPSFKNLSKQKDKQGSHYRMLRSRYNRGTLKYGAMVDVLIEFGYQFKVRKP